MIVVRGCEFPEDRHYHAGHNVWLKEEGGIVTLGATSFGAALAREFMGFVPKPAGTVVEADRSVGVVELWKTMVSVRTPVAGTILEWNAAATKDPALIHRDPYGEGWLVRLQAVDWDRASTALLRGVALVPAFEAAMDLERFTGPQDYA
jgi:glycine cleavage system H lipoate-binding protein